MGSRHGNEVGTERTGTTQSLRTDIEKNVIRVHSPLLKVPLFCGFSQLIVRFAIARRRLTAVLLLNNPHEPWSIDEFERIFLPWENGTRIGLHMFDHSKRLIPREIGLHNRLQPEVNHKPEPSNSPVLLGDFLFCECWSACFFHRVLYQFERPCPKPDLWRVFVGFAEG